MSIQMAIGVDDTTHNERASETVDRSWERESESREKLHVRAVTSIRADTDRVCGRQMAHVCLYD